MIGGVVAVAGTVTVALVVVPRLVEPTAPTDTPGSSQTAGPPQTAVADPGTTSPKPTTEPTAEETPGTLLTPDGIRHVVAALKKASGGEQFIEMSVHSGHASAKAPVKGKPKMYDRYTYRDGQVTRDPGGILSFGEKAVAFDVFDWDVLPKVQRAAEQRLGIDKPTSRYVIVQGAWTFADDQPTILYYLSDEYGGAYLAADRKGKVVRVYARED